MKYTKKIVSLLAVCFLLQTAKAQVSNADTMIHKLFTTLKAKDEKAYVALYPNATQFGTMMRVMMERMLNSEQMKQMMAMDEKSKNINIDSLINTEVSKLNNPLIFGEMQKDFAKDFQKIIEKGEKKGVNWSEAKLESYTIDSSALDDEDMKMFQGSGIKNMKGIMNFTVGDSAYQMSFTKIVYLPTEGGWFGGEFPQVVRKGESLSSLNEGHENLNQRIDNAQSGEGALPSEKSKIKSPGVKTKARTKTKTPARKSTTKS
jgi:hypothetical protein